MITKPWSNGAEPYFKPNATIYLMVDVISGEQVLLLEPTTNRLGLQSVVQAAGERTVWSLWLLKQE